MAAFDDTFCCSLATPLQLPTAATQPVSQSYHFMSMNMCFVITYIITVMIQFHLLLQCQLNEQIYKLQYLIGDEDYTGGDYFVTFQPGDFVSSFTVDIVNDNIYEGRETFDIAIVLSPSQDYVVSGNCNITVTIVDYGKLLWL